MTILFNAVLLLCVGAHVCLWVHMCACVSGSQRGHSSGYPPFLFLFFSFRLALSLTWNSQHRVSWLASEAKGSTYPASPALTLHVHIPILSFFLLSRFWGSDLKVFIHEAFCWLSQLHICHSWTYIYKTNDHKTLYIIIYNQDNAAVLICIFQ